ncbi:MAG: hypothetical protein IPO91_33900 [Chloroflexi bacterium]|nr:hypothetical protein [Chloroflexota bacterium]
MWAFLVILLQLQTLQTPILIDVCPAFGVPVSGSGYDRTFVDYALDAEAINAVLSIDASDSFWVGYENGGFDWPQDVQPVLQLTLMMADGAERWLDVWWSAETPEVYYALPFVTVEAYADAQGEHYGTHPCAAVRMSAADFEALREAITR